MEWLPGSSPASAQFVIRLRWSVVLMAPILLALSPLKTDYVIIGILVLFGLLTAAIHYRFYQEGNAKIDRLLWYAIFALDLVLITAVIYLRAGLHSDVHNLYFLAILQVALLYTTREALASSLASGILYTLSIWSMSEDFTDVKRALIRAIYMLLIGVAASYLATAEKRAIILSLTDFKTRLPNFRHFHQSLQRTVTMHQRSGEPLTVAILDVDNFKALNARIGHPGADQVLEQLAELLSKHKRQSDMLARYGGEEFVIYLPGVGPTQALPALERFRTIVAEHPFEVEGLAEPVQITISVGAAIMPDDAGTERELLVGADAALHEAKRMGKNRCLLHDTTKTQAV